VNAGLLPPEGLRAAAWVAARAGGGARARGAEESGLTRGLTRAEDPPKNEKTARLPASPTIPFPSKNANRVVPTSQDPSGFNVFANHSTLSRGRITAFRSVLMRLAEAMRMRHVTLVASRNGRRPACRSLPVVGFRPPRSTIETRGQASRKSNAVTDPRHRSLD
jgi:hypothetical protein